MAHCLEHRSGRKARWSPVGWTDRQGSGSHALRSAGERETRLLRLVGKSRKLFVFLREHRHEIFDEKFQEELEAMYRDSGQGEEPQPPALLCMAVLLQGYLQVSDAESVRLSAIDKWI